LRIARTFLRIIAFGDESLTGVMYVGTLPSLGEEGSMRKLRESLVDAEYHSAEGQALVDEQRAHVVELTQQGNDARDAEHLLVQFEAAKELLNTDRDRLRRLVGNIESDWPQSAA
jgi:hypothetical protein